jgi:ribosomal protein L11 methylase PrmA
VNHLGSSFRDPNGFVFLHDGVIYRQVQLRYRREYDHLLGSGLYQELAAGGLLIPHEEASPDLARLEGAYRVLAPERIPFISYPYEWGFSQLKAAALLTLDIQSRALRQGMCLKDASAFNVQFIGSRPVFIDTLSFDMYHEGRPWVAYHQFCEHFLAPLALMSLVDERLGSLFSVHIDGVPLDLASRLLPRRSWLRTGLLVHLHLHARGVVRYGDREVGSIRTGEVSRRGLDALLGHLRSTVAGLRWNPSKTEWAAYGEEHGYEASAIEAKQIAVDRMLQEVRPRTVWDLGANTGMFSRIAAESDAKVVALDLDAGAVERHYLDLRDRREERVLPLVMNLANASGALGFAHRERMSLEDRGPTDLLLALALIHHLSITNNVPLPLLADWLARLGRWLIIEWVPKDDPQTRRLLRAREDVFADYEIAVFERAFQERFTIVRRIELPNSARALYLMHSRGLS